MVGSGPEPQAGDSGGPAGPQGGVGSEVLGPGRKERSPTRKRAPGNPTHSPRASDEPAPSVGLEVPEPARAGESESGSGACGRSPRVFSPGPMCPSSRPRGASPRCPARSRPKRLEVVLHLFRRKKKGRRGDVEVTKSRPNHFCGAELEEPRGRRARPRRQGQDSSAPPPRSRSHSRGLPGRASPARARQRAHSPTRAHCHAPSRTRTPARAHRHSHADTRTRGGRPSASPAPWCQA